MSEDEHDKKLSGEYHDREMKCIASLVHCNDLLPKRDEEGP